ncbi:heme lyase NrfEFG subunit NrfE [Vibrio sp. SCSIO 43136]|uniref:heme lyase CcmF/NrfE family subunit n=1 Tax=Vibrio sp. SCSIO 43136 TaxID=2819101 RepID=UPI002074E8F9|nr:heme lyase NrfEFG subunit NrfE [Vibrio sp. SCSIO 43136]USD66385.1 heme lyase NrfEFG subunit NrfE [Vibrio sp. SCSIO 43136]
MLASIGVFALVVVLVSSSLGVLTTLYQLKSQRFDGRSMIFAKLTFIASISAMLILAFAFYLNDFSIQYVIDHSNTRLPLFYRIAAVWGGHEGSLLFWLVIIATWSLMIFPQAKRIDNGYAERFLMLMQLLSVLFCGFILFLSNPFITTEIVPIDGRDLNPMLQDFGLVIHPPFLYLGYVGFAAIFALAFAALLMKEIPAQWFTLCQRWNLWAWSWLTLGIVIGSWWAYNELGWGGWWFWDPVENASLLPWLTSTALIHTLLASRYYSQLKLWSFVLAIVSFCLSVLGTFLIRSGLLTSVHAFALDPTKGVILLAILGVLLFSALGVLVWRSDEIVDKSIPSVWSPTLVLLIAAGLATLVTCIVLIGTFYPMVYQLAGLGSISVGAPYFNQLVAPISSLVIACLFLLPHLNFADKAINKTTLATSGVVATACMIAALLFTQVSLFVASVFGLAVATILHLIVNFRRKSPSSLLAHIGFALACLGAFGNSALSDERSFVLTIDTPAQFNDFEVNLVTNDYLIGSNYTAERLAVELRRDGQTMHQLMPEKRHYFPREVVMSEASVSATLLGDYYITMGEKFKPGEYAVRIQYRAMIRWVWLGALLMACAPIVYILGARVSVSRKKRYA